MSGHPETPSDQFTPLGEQQDLSQVLVSAFDVLSAGARDRRSPFHTPVFASLGLDGRPTGRVVVLRAFSPDQRQLRFHTDIRTHKFSQLAADPRASFVFYDAALKVQIRCEGTTVLHHRDAVAEAAWQASQRMSRLCYGTSPAPGHEIGQPDDFSLPADPDTVAAGQQHFCAVVTTITSLEWLWLGHNGHRRARFIWDEDGQVDAVWLVP